MIYKQVKNRVEKIARRFYIVEFLVIILLGSFVLENFDGFSNIKWLVKIDRLGQKKEWNGLRETEVSFLRKNLVMDWDYYHYLSTSGKKKAIWPDRNIYSSPVFLSPTEKKPYYLFNFDIDFGTYPFRLFRNFTKGDGTLKFAEEHKEIKALVFYGKDSAKVMKINRKIDRVVWENEMDDLQNMVLSMEQIDALSDLLDFYLRGDTVRVKNRGALLQILSQLVILKSGRGKTLGILFFED